MVGSHGIHDIVPFHSLHVALSVTCTIIVGVYVHRSSHPHIIDVSVDVAVPGHVTIWSYHPYVYLTCHRMMHSRDLVM